MAYIAFGIDSGGYSAKGGFAWLKLSDSAIGALPSCPAWPTAHDPSILAQEVIGSLANENRVMIGIEAPLWIPQSPVTHGLLPDMPYRFPAEQGSEWYIPVGGGVAMMGVAILADLLAAVAGACAATVVTDDPFLWQCTPTSILIYETFLPKKPRHDEESRSSPPGCWVSASCATERQIQDMWDALVTSAAGLLCFPLRPPPAQVPAWLGSRKLEILAPSPPAMDIPVQPGRPLWQLAVPRSMTVALARFQPYTLTLS